MPFFAILHLYAFSHKDFIDSDVSYCGRLPFIHAFRDSVLGFKDVLEDSLTTFHGSGFSYKTFEPAEGALHHQGLVRERRVRAGLRYSKGGKHKYWLPMAGETEEAAHGRKYAQGGDADGPSRWESIISYVTPSHEERRLEEGYAPLMPDQAAEVVHREQHDPDENEEGARKQLKDHQMSTVGRWDVRPADAQDSDSEEGDSELDEVIFGDPRLEEEDLYRDARRLEFGDYNNPVLDASKEEARALMRAIEEGMLARHPSAPSSRVKGKSKAALRKRSLLHDDELSDDNESSSKLTSPPTITSTRSKLSLLSFGRGAQSLNPLDELPEGCVDLLVEDKSAIESKARRERLKGEANRWTGAAPQKIFKVLHPEVSLAGKPPSPIPTCKHGSTSLSIHEPDVSQGDAAVVAVVDQSDAVQATATSTPDVYDLQSETTEQLERLTNRSNHNAREGDRLKVEASHVSLSSSMVHNPWDDF